MLKRRKKSIEPNRNKEEALQAVVSDQSKKRININIPVSMYIDFRKKLLERGLNGTNWLREQVVHYCRSEQTSQRILKEGKGSNFEEGFKVFNVLLEHPVCLKFRKKLLDENISMSDWVRGQINGFIAEV